MQTNPIGLFEAYGVELEYMIVDADTLQVRPITDQLFHACAGDFVSDIERSDMAWSNELARHVIEIKTNGPAPRLEQLEHRFQAEVHHINSLLKSYNAKLMPTAMHPWMDPTEEFQLWPHENSPIYEAFHQIFDCGSHGWANLQSVHLNLPFANDEEFGRLHAAIRLLMPIMPALSASSPLVEGSATGLLDNRLEHYRHHTRRVPCLTARVIPEPVFTRTAYDTQILRPIRQQLIPFDPEHQLQPEWSNARGAIARFDRGTIEIRILDVQECPAADLAICRAIANVLRRIIAEQWTSWSEQQAVPVTPLADLLLRTIAEGECATIEDPAYLAHFGLKGTLAAGDVWRALFPTSPEDPHLARILRQGPLARRILRAAGNGRNTYHEIYQQLCECLAQGQPFDAA